jgi:hypothetical protein
MTSSGKTVMATGSVIAAVFTAATSSTLWRWSPSTAAPTGAVRQPVQRDRRKSSLASKRSGSPLL